MTLIRMAYYAKYEMNATITTPEGQYTIPIRTKTVIDDYDNDWIGGGADAYSLTKKLNECFQLIDEIADDSFRMMDIFHASKTGLCQQVWLESRDHDENIQNLLYAAHVNGVH